MVKKSKQLERQTFRKAENYDIRDNGMLQIAEY